MKAVVSKEGRRRYGVWAGNPTGREEDTSRCIESVYERLSHGHQCERKRGHGPDGLYCKQHDPEAIKARNAERDRKWKFRMDYENQRFSDERVGSWLRQNDPSRYEEIQATTEGKRKAR